MPTLLYQQNNLEIFWDNTEKWLQATWSGEQNEADLKRGCEQILRLLVARHTDSLLNDHSGVQSAWHGAADWMGKDWLPRMRAAGLRSCAWVYPATGQAQPASTQQAPSGTPTAATVFWNVDEAVKWLSSQRRRNTITQRIMLPPELRGR